MGLAARAPGGVRRVTSRVGHLRPQAFGRRNVKDVRDPLIEPYWEGDRLVVDVTDGVVLAVDVDGERVDLEAEIADDLLRLARAGHLLLDAHRTPQAARTSEGAVVADVSIPTSVELAGQMLVGRGRTRRSELAGSAPEPDPGAERVLVVVDLLEIDADSLLDVPLLERKRILESALEEGERVRVGAFVRPPVDAWLGTWRALGFRSVAYKAANGRYLPGEPNDGWALAVIPRR
jgi:hypothetical protein